jgi:uncharacterized membrane protein YeaQ/YmgE (transglycosylase-associated protein family)
MAFFGFLTLGAIIGWLSHTFSGNHGIKLIPSIIVGIMGALIGGSLVLYFDLKGSGFYAAIASTGILFTINAFRKKKPIFVDSEN